MERALSTRVTGPLFKWFGSKWLSSKNLPAPVEGVICEPFAGGAGYSLRHSDKGVILAESNALVFALWQWLIRSATEESIREIPIGVLEGTDIRTLGLTEGQALLMKHWQRTNTVGNCWSVSPWGNKPGQWTANTRARVASEVGAIAHWHVYPSANTLFRAHTKRATWFIDPPYKYNYQYGCPPTDYAALARRVHTLRGQVIVCEAADPKTGVHPRYLPFRVFGERITSRRKANQHRYSKELLYTVTR